jgi:hypothetical protein
LKTPNGDFVFSVTTLYGAKARQPMVEIKAQGLDVQMSPAEARALALNLLSAAEAATSDAFLFEFTQQSIGDDGHAAAVLHLFREWRSRHDAVPGSEYPNHKGES